MKATVNYYSEFSPQRVELRKQWSGTGLDWEQYLKDAELKHQSKVKAVRTKPRQKSEIERIIPLVMAFISIVGVLTLIFN